MAEISEQTQVADVERRLTSKYAQLPPDQISSVVRQAHARFEQSPIRDFVPLLVERHARAELAKASQPAMAEQAIPRRVRASFRAVGLTRKYLREQVGVFGYVLANR